MGNSVHPDGLRELWIGTHMSGEVAVTERRREAEVWDRAGWRVEGPFVHADHQAAEQGAVELLSEAAAALRDLLGWIPANQPEHRRIGALITRIEQGGG